MDNKIHCGNHSQWCNIIDEAARDAVEQVEPFVPVEVACVVMMASGDCIWRVDVEVNCPSKDRDVDVGLNRRLPIPSPDLGHDPDSEESALHLDWPKNLSSRVSGL
jgi:hypothetical protein